MYDHGISLNTILVHSIILKKDVCDLGEEFISVKRLYFIFAWDLAAVRIIGVSVIAGCPQGESWLYFREKQKPNHPDKIPRKHRTWGRHRLSESNRRSVLL